jgi:dienelactone hydrolase
MRLPIPTVFAFCLAASACTQALKLSPDDSKTVLARQTIAAPNPGENGPLRFQTLYYGSGTDKQRRHFHDSVTLKTSTVDGSAFVSMEPPQAKDREKYWGFNFKKLPVNGRVWYPEGNGPFPLVLVVHGNHNMKEFSDPGYQYLGEHLASRGFIVASVDENFLNGNIRGENDARAWMLLKHLEQWKKWNDSTGGPFRGKVDMQRIALMGHSRGGEAVGHAAAFNRLPFYPDDANQKLGFNFGIKAVVAIAPVDGQYMPAGILVPIENVNYLVIHGSHDGDVSAFSGLRTFQRLRFTDGQPWFKSAWYVYRANHGQWNSVWGNKDGGPRSARWLDLRGLIPEADQRRFGQVVIGAFLEATLHDKREYLPMFRDHRMAGAWLPKTMYITRFQESGYHALASYEEDVNVTTGAVRGVSLQGDSLATWRENMLNLRWQNTPQFSNAVWLGWNNRIAGPDTTKFGSPASYSLTLSDSLVSALGVNDSSAVYLSLAPTEAKPGARQPKKDSTAKADSAKKAPAPKPKAEPKKKTQPDTTPVDLDVELTDANGVTAKLPISRFGVPRRPLETRVYRRANRDKTQFANMFEIVLQTYVLPVSEFKRVAPQLDATRLRRIRLLFDRIPAGTVIVDDIGVSTPAPGFMSANF